jgi:hypothetical protein
MFFLSAATDIATREKVVNSIMTVHSANDGAVVQYRDVDGYPVPFQVTIQRRILTPDGEEFHDGASEWATCTVRNVIAEVDGHGAVAAWLALDTRVDLNRLDEYPADAPAYLWNRNAA